MERGLNTQTPPGYATIYPYNMRIAHVQKSSPPPFL